MRTSVCVGRIGGFAAAVGVGAAVLTGAGAAWAHDTGGTDPGVGAERADHAASTPRHRGPGRSRGVSKPADPGGELSAELPRLSRPAAAVPVDEPLPEVLDSQPIPPSKSVTSKGITVNPTTELVDGIVPSIAWNSLVQSLYPSSTFKTAWANPLLLGLELLPLISGAEPSRINDLIYQAVLTGDLFGAVSQSVQALAGSSGPTALLTKLQTPTLLLQGTFDALFPLAEAVSNAETIIGNPYGTPVRMVWFCGGHGRCADPVNPDQQGEIYRDTFAWLDRYVADKTDPAEVPAFQLYDQTGQYYASGLMPFQDGFNKPEPYRATGGAPAVGSQIVGAPELSFTYNGLGTSRAVFAQLVDNKTGRVVGSIVTPVPVKLDGRTHTVRVPLEQIAYTVYDPKDTLTLQIAGFGEAVPELVGRGDRGVGRCAGSAGSGVGAQEDRWLQLRDVSPSHRCGYSVENAQSPAAQGRARGRDRYGAL